MRWLNFLMLFTLLLPLWTLAGGDKLCDVIDPHNSDEVFSMAIIKIVDGVNTRVYLRRWQHGEWGRDAGYEWCNVEILSLNKKARLVTILLDERQYFLKIVLDAELSKRADACIVDMEWADKDCK